MDADSDRVAVDERHTVALRHNVELEEGQRDTEEEPLDDKDADTESDAHGPDAVGDGAPEREPSVDLDADREPVVDTLEDGLREGTLLLDALREDDCAPEAVRATTVAVAPTEGLTIAFVEVRDVVVLDDTPGETVGASPVGDTSGVEERLGVDEKE